MDLAIRVLANLLLDTLPTAISPARCAMAVEVLCAQSFRLLAILAWMAGIRRFLWARWASAKASSWVRVRLTLEYLTPSEQVTRSLSPRSMPISAVLVEGSGRSTAHWKLTYQCPWASWAKLPVLIMPCTGLDCQKRTCWPFSTTVPTPSLIARPLKGIQPSDRFLLRQRKRILRNCFRFLTYSLQTSLS